MVSLWDLVRRAGAGELRAQAEAPYSRRRRFRIAFRVAFSTTIDVGGNALTKPLKLGVFQILDWQGPIGARRNLSFATLGLEHRHSMAAPLNFAD